MRGIYTLFGIMLCAASATQATVPNQYLRDSIPSQWNYDAQYTQTLPSEDQWWKSLSDPLLDSLISHGIDNNFNIAIAARRINIARQTIRNAKAAYYPTLGISAGWISSRNSGNTTSTSMPHTDLNYFSTGIDMAWQIDLFGKITSKVRQGKAQWLATQAEYAATMVSICGDIASAYIRLRTLQTELAVAQQHLESQCKVLKIAEARHEAGLASKLDVAQAATIYYSTEASIPELESSIKTSINAISILIGEYPETITSKLVPIKPIPEYRQIVGIGIPLDLLRRRPDIVQAEYSLAAAAAAVGIAKKDFLPSLTIEGSIGVASHSIDKIFDSNSFTYSIAPKLSWTIFDGMARNASLVTARENMQVSIDQYNLALMTAVQEVDNTMVSYKYLLRSIDYLQNVVAQAKEAFDLSIDLYKQGLTDFTDVADAQISYLQYSDQLAVEKGNAAVALIKLYEALGGGWDISELIK